MSGVLSLSSAAVMQLSGMMPSTMVKGHVACDLLDNL